MHYDSFKKGCLKNPLHQNVRQLSHLPSCTIRSKLFGGQVLKTASKVEPIYKNAIYPMLPHYDTL